MKSLARALVWIGAIAGSALLFWKGWEGMAYFIHELVASTMEENLEISKFLPGYLVAALGIMLISLSQICSAWPLGPKLKILGVFRGLFLLISAAGFSYATGLVIQAFAQLATTGG